MFRDWMLDVDKFIERLCGLTSDDLPDWRWWDAYLDGCFPEDAARECLKGEGFVFDEEE